MCVDRPCPVRPRTSGVEFSLGSTTGAVDMSQMIQLFSVVHELVQRSSYHTLPTCWSRCLHAIRERADSVRFCSSRISPDPDFTDSCSIHADFEIADWIWIDLTDGFLVFSVRIDR